RVLSSRPRALATTRARRHLLVLRRAALLRARVVPLHGAAPADLPMTTTWTARVAVIAIAAATIAGTALDPSAPNPPLVRAGWRVLQVDLHAHTTFSDGTFSPFDVVVQARRRG